MRSNFMSSTRSSRTEQLYDRILLEMISYLTHAMEDKA